MQQPGGPPMGPGQPNPNYGAAPATAAPKTNLASGCSQIAGLLLVLLSLLFCAGAGYSYTRYTSALNRIDSWGSSYGSFGAELGATIAKKWYRNLLVSGGASVVCVFVGASAFVIGRWVLRKKN